MLFRAATILSAIVSLTFATPIIYDGRAPLNYTEADIDGPKAPYVYVVRGSKNSSYYVDFDKILPPPTPLWIGKLPGFLPLPKLTEQTVKVKIDNSSVFVPGGNPANAQYGFRRTEIIAQNDRNAMETGTTVFHFSILKDDLHPLNPKHEYQIVFIEPNDGTHVFQVRYGSNFANPTQAHLPTSNAFNLEITDHALNVIYSVPFKSLTWYNFAVQVDWTNRTLGVFASQNADQLEKVSKLRPNLSATAGPDGQGDFHFGVIKLPLVNPTDSEADKGDVVHHGIQEGTTEALYYSGVFVESITKGVSTGYGKTTTPITA
ncbi:hypothetical protein M407DRAFT_221102 [Tulasnella calospora MUT 4182]|uniref:Glycoside hydrolase 131 catalytic N-terminal domain-containing protein n=1 Tax=Tulasnella calospora MUT 4182 TaxID=1051891 RepID=A0A0C3PYC3_9AGAM|nr:hypothetical protein M407DRAFT_221102 [Tulasnella calospora MUT 4182]